MKTKLIILAIVIIVLGGGWYYYENYLNIGWESFVSEGHGFSFKYPNNWTTDTDQSTGSEIILHPKELDKKNYNPDSVPDISGSKNDYLYITTEDLINQKDRGFDPEPPMTIIMNYWWNGGYKRLYFYCFSFYDQEKTEKLCSEISRSVRGD